MAHYAVPYGTRAGARVPADVDSTVHTIYVKVGADDAKNREITLELLKYIHSQKPTFAQMGLAVKISKVRSQDLQAPRLVEAMRERGITRLPALVTPKNVFIGLKAIVDVYEQNIKEFDAVLRRREPPGAKKDEDDEDDLTNYYRGEMESERDDADDDEKGIGEGGSMMDSYRQMMEHRENSGRGRPRPRPPPRPPPRGHWP